jgi:hypothetical protein
MIIDYLLFKSQADLVENVNNYEPKDKEDVLIAIAPVSIDEASAIRPDFINSSHYFYKVYLIQDSEIWGVSYLFADYALSEAFSDYTKNCIAIILENYFKDSLKNPGNKTDINHQLYKISEDSQNEIKRPEPILYSYPHCSSPLSRPASADVDILMRELENNLNVFEL